MSARATCLALVLCTAGILPAAYAQSTDTKGAKLPNDIEFKGLTGAPQSAVLYGDPTKPGVFVTRVKFAPGMKNMPHWHPDEVRTTVVLAGTLYFAVGEQWDESKFTPLSGRHVLLWPPKTPHYTWAKDGEVILQITGVGPTGTVRIPQK